jgi:hypothetical protein
LSVAHYDEFSDVTFVCEGDNQIKAHKVIHVIVVIIEPPTVVTLKYTDVIQSILKIVYFRI